MYSGIKLRLHGIKEYVSGHSVLMPLKVLTGVTNILIKRMDYLYLHECVAGRSKKYNVELRDVLSRN